MPASTPRQCPTCGRIVEWSDLYPHRPFCSERCRLVDLGAWFSEARGIPGDGSPDTTQDAPADSTGSRDA